jgi:hypothetical protein
MLPYYSAEDDFATHYWDRFGVHYVICKDRDRPECQSCRRVIPPACSELELGEMTRYIWEVKKLTLAQQAEVLLLHPAIGDYWEWWEPFGDVHEEEDEWPERVQSAR